MTFSIKFIFFVVVIATYLYYEFVWRANKERGGFRDWVKNPKYKEEMSRLLHMKQNLTVPEDISDDEIRRMVERIFVKDDFDFNVERLKLVGEKAIPFLLEALNDPRIGTMKFKEGGHGTAPKTPFERLVKVLEPLGPPDAAGPLAKLVEHHEVEFREHAAIALGNIGSEECIQPMLKALSDEDEYVISYAMLGIQRGITAGRCTREFLESMFPAVAVLLKRDNFFTHRDAPGVLLRIDEEKAKSLLTSSEYVSNTNPNVHHIFEVMNEHGHKIPLVVLLPFLKEIKPNSGQFPHDCGYAGGLIAYSLNPDSDAEVTFREGLESRSERVREAAANSLAILSGVSNARAFAFDRENKIGFDQLSEPQKYYIAVFIYDAEVNNGGHTQYFVNSAGDRWKFAQAGLEAINSRHRLSLLRQATKQFGKNGPPVDNGARHQKLAAFSKTQDKELENIDSQYYKSEENIEVLLASYALRKKEHFREASS